jgi:hypothetical protein
MTGRAVAGPIDASETPGSFSTVAATVVSMRRSISAPDTTDTGLSSS